MFELEWTRPWGLGALVLPLLVLLLSLRRELPRPLSVGTFALWAELPDEVGVERRRRRIPLGRALLLLALTLAALALAGPRRRSVEPPRTLEVVVDPSPSMFLTDSSGSTRLARAVGELEERLDAEVTLEWIRPRAGGEERATGAFPAAWHEPPYPAREGPLWQRFDRPGLLWLTDRAPEEEPLHGGLVASGGPAVPGPVATAGERWLHWTGTAIEERPGAPRRAVLLDGPLPEPIVSVVEIWARERGFALGAEALPVALEVARHAAGPREPLTVGRDGWSAEASVHRAPVEEEGAALETWLAVPAPGGRALPVVTWRAGRVVLALESLAEPEGDPAAFAVSWSELLDAALLPPPGVVSRTERADAGPPVYRAPSPASSPEAHPIRRWPLVSICAAAAAGLALAALVAGGGRP